MIPIILRTIRDRWRMLLAVTLIGVLSMLMYVSMYPTYQKSLAQSQEIFKDMPEALLKAFNMESLSFDTLEKFLNIEMYSLFWLVLAIILTLSLAGSSLAGEVERETATLTASQPIARTTHYLGKFLAAAALFTTFNVLVNASAVPFAAAFGLPILAGHYFVVGVMCELFGLALLGLGFAVSSFLSDKGKVYMTLGGVILVMYVLNIVSAIQPSIEQLKYASLFHYFDPNKFLVKGHYDLTATLVFTAVLLAGLLVGWWRWQQRDLA